MASTWAGGQGSEQRPGDPSPHLPCCSTLPALAHLLTTPDDAAAQVATRLGVDHGWGALLGLQVGEVDSPALSFLPETEECKKRKERKSMTQKSSYGTRHEGEPVASPTLPSLPN